MNIVSSIAGRNLRCSTRKKQTADLLTSDYLVASADPNPLWLRSLAPRISSYSVDSRLAPRPRRVWNAAAGVLRRLYRKTNSSRYICSWALLNTVVRAYEPLLKVSNSPIGKRDGGLRTFSQLRAERLDASDMFKAGL